MRFQVPQFIDIEDKIFGPLTLKQFIYLTGGGGIIVTSWLYLPFFIFIIIALPIGFLTFALTFLKVNRRPFIMILEAAFKFLLKNKLYLWQKTADIHPLRSEEVKLQNGSGKNKLKDTVWSLEIKNDKEPTD